MEIPRDLLNIIRDEVIAANMRDKDNIIGRGITYFYHRNKGHINMYIALRYEKHNTRHFFVNQFLQFKILGRKIYYRDQNKLINICELYEEKLGHFIFTIYGERGLVLEVSIKRKQMADIIAGYFSRNVFDRTILCVDSIAYFLYEIPACSVFNNKICAVLHYKNKTKKYLRGWDIKLIEEYYLVEDDNYKIKISCEARIYICKSINRIFEIYNRYAKEELDCTFIDSGESYFIQDSDFGMLLKCFRKV